MFLHIVCNNLYFDWNIRLKRNEIIWEKVVIIGAGPAGLTAGLELLSDGSKQYEVVILEESNAIGGISRTVYHNGNRMDIGRPSFLLKER